MPGLTLMIWNREKINLYVFYCVDFIVLTIQLFKTKQGEKGNKKLGENCHKPSLLTPSPRQYNVVMCEMGCHSQELMQINLRMCCYAELAKC